ncbi:ribosomal protein S18-alanine N-acetyltransferase [Actinomyces trachealis]|uniref:ribosomal protein S18-alanine N-acetyltransferase n=1 Tax=Actinomyces trachealis TaxID=2763540 RepID=UPI001FD4539F|nr:ribosomal protein S18-alanine N-acetyltransferase [Actinomyces trachealis]
MNAWRLRPMVAADLPRVAELEQELFGAEAWSRQLLSAELEAANDASGLADRNYLVAESESAAGQPAELIGYAGVWFGDGRGDADLLTIATVPPWRRHGVGGALLDAAVEVAQRAGCRNVLLEVRESNAGAQRLYRSRGFKQLGRRRRYYVEPVEDALVLRLALSGALGIG